MIISKRPSDIANSPVATCVLAFFMGLGRITKAPLRSCYIPVAQFKFTDRFYLIIYQYYVFGSRGVKEVARGTLQFFRQ